MSGLSHIEDELANLACTTEAELREIKRKLDRIIDNDDSEDRDSRMKPTMGDVMALRRDLTTLAMQVERLVGRIEYLEMERE